MLPPSKSDAWEQIRFHRSERSEPDCRHQSMTKRLADFCRSDLGLLILMIVGILTLQHARKKCPCSAEVAAANR